MPNVLTVLKQEINRLSKKQAKAAVAPVRTWAAGARQGVADLKRRVAELEKQNRLLQAAVARLGAAQPAAKPEAPSKDRVTTKGIKGLRKRLRLSGPEFAQLVGVVPQAVYNWEKGSGALKVRPTTRAAILAVRGIGAREAKQRLADMPAPAKKKTVRRRKTAKRK